MISLLTMAISIPVAYYGGLDRGKNANQAEYTDTLPLMNLGEARARLESLLNLCKPVPHILGNLTVRGALVGSERPTEEIENPIAFNLSDETAAGYPPAYAFATAAQKPEGGYEVNHIFGYDGQMMILHTYQPFRVRESTLRCNTSAPDIGSKPANGAVDSSNEQLYVTQTTPYTHEVLDSGQAQNVPDAIPLQIGIVESESIIYD